MAKFDLNKQNDEMLRKGSSELYKIEKEKARKKEILSNGDNKQKLMNFLFGKSEVNPLSKK